MLPGENSKSEGLFEIKIEKDCKTIENKEVKKGPTEMSRVFICRPRTLSEMEAELDDLSKPIDWEKLNFTSLLFMEKSAKSTAPGQLMPVGGRVWEEDKNILGTALRNMMRKTHLRPQSIKMLSEQPVTYKIRRNNGGKNENENEEMLSTHYFFAKIAPYDQAYPIDVETHKIMRFHEISPEGWGRLMRGEALDEGNSQLKLLDSLQPRDKEPEESEEHHKAERLSRLAVGGAVEEKWQEMELKKMERVYYFFIKILGMEEKEGGWSSDLKTNDKIKAMKRKIATLFDEEDSAATRIAFKEALDLSNLEDELVGEEIEGQQTGFETVLRFVYVLLESKFNLDEYLTVAEQNPYLKKFVGKLKTFIDTLSASELGDERYSNQLKAIDSLDDELLQAAFFDSFFPGESAAEATERTTQMNSAVNWFIDSELARHQVGSLLDDIDDSLLRQMPEITNASVADLLRIALPGVGKDKKRRMKATPALKERYKTDDNQLERFVFEARRKLAMFILLSDFDTRYDEVRSGGNEPLNKMFENIFGGPVIKCRLVKEILISEVLKRTSVRVKKVLKTYEDFAGKDLRKFSTKNIVLECEDIRLRPFIDEQGENLFCVSQDPRVKTRASWYRKALVRGSNNPQELNNDIFGRALVISPPGDSPEEKVSVLKRKQETFNLGVEAEGKFSFKDEMVEDYAPVIEIMRKISREEGVKIFNYKPTNQTGSAFSSSMGNGDKICLAKFYVRKITKDGRVFMEEVQIFSPTPDGKSGYDHRNDKIEADAYYSFRRLHTVQGLRSGVEIIFPSSIYPIYKIIKDRGNDKSK